MKCSKRNRKLRGFWYKKDIDGWVNFMNRIGHFYKDHENSLFKNAMTVWNTQFTHEDFLKNHYEGWKPYCCSNIPCASSAWDRMVRTEFGWECPFCKTIAGKHLYAIKRTSYGPVRFLGGWDNWCGIPSVDYVRQYPDMETK